jgi:hypothetical protein
MKEKEPADTERMIQKTFDEYFKERFAGHTKNEKASGHTDGASINLNRVNYSKLLEDIVIENQLKATQTIDKFHQVISIHRDGLLKAEIDGEVRIHTPEEFHLGISTQEAESTEPVVLTPQPPLDAEFVLHLLLNKDEQDALIGDLIERYARKCERLGVRRANLWFYAEVVRTAWPLIKRVIAKAGGLIAVGEWLRRHIS